MSIQRRIERAEKAIGIQDKPVVIPNPIISNSYDEGTAPHFPEPAEEWLTLRETVETSRRQSVPGVLFPDPFAEYEARNGLEPGILAQHPMCGKVPFAELLTTATEGEQICRAD